MSVKTDLVKEFLVGRIQGAVADLQGNPLPAETEAALTRGASELREDYLGRVDEALAAEVARAGYLARVAETELFEAAREPPTALVGLLNEVWGGAWEGAIGSACARLATAEPAGRPNPDDDRAMTWRIPGPGGHVRHYVALDAIGSLAGDAAVDQDASAGVALKRCWLYGFFLRACGELVPPHS